jgi:hypothetical protein
VNIRSFFPLDTFYAWLSHLHLRVYQTTGSIAVEVVYSIDIQKLTFTSSRINKSGSVLSVIQYLNPKEKIRCKWLS